MNGGDSELPIRDSDDALPPETTEVDTCGLKVDAVDRPIYRAFWKLFTADLEILVILKPFQDSNMQYEPEYNSNSICN